MNQPKYSVHRVKILSALRKMYVKFLYRLANLLITWGYALHDKALLMDWEKIRDSEN